MIKHIVRMDGAYYSERKRMSGKRVLRSRMVVANNAFAQANHGRVKSFVLQAYFSQSDDRNHAT